MFRPIIYYGIGIWAAALPAWGLEYKILTPDITFPVRIEKEAAPTVAMPQTDAAFSIKIEHPSPSPTPENTAIASSPFANNGQSPFPAAGRTYRIDFGNERYNFTVVSDNEILLTPITQGSIYRTHAAITTVSPTLYLISWRTTDNQPRTQVLDLRKAAIYEHSTDQNTLSLKKGILTLLPKPGES
ncbi:hypothetical protein PL75_04305 [Neisseria arctica]|uniref:MoaF-like domain-containing protein n=1 Tax=Neisseria arctica TaxID=1470200 RepID=A0A0J0YSK4_9NEIS|nr:hypothetical protein [Neisseria arctica]KLT73135.1 hypothetical protein PL75_04305 [Neisseria arctica]UOO87133.1 hypothetical protein LVJ86_02465 [Neisseria arctica]